MNEWLTHTVTPMFDDRVLPITEDIMLTWRVLPEDGRKAGHTYSQPDLMIGVSAVVGRLSVVTRKRE